ncbi:mushroom body large-type Kenyon cell-specific protein 1-like [Vespula maculifrons]|uniref:Mushroom body large-type Kenyon cell-specific protein 1-like n=1 Tax=Vespula maculifrons TaxID=7453 RepID=A0ABD2AR13_VESMC
MFTIAITILERFERIENSTNYRQYSELLAACLLIYEVHSIRKLEKLCSFIKIKLNFWNTSGQNNANVDVGPPVVVQAAQAQKKESHENIARIAKRYLDDNMQQAWINPRLISMGMVLIGRYNFNRYIYKKKKKNNVSRRSRERFFGSEIGVYHGLEGRSSKEEEYLDTSALCASLAHHKSSFKIIESTGGIIMAILITYCRAVPRRRSVSFLNNGRTTQSFVAIVIVFIVK